MINSPCWHSGGGGEGGGGGLSPVGAGGDDSGGGGGGGGGGEPSKMDVQETYVFPPRVCYVQYSACSEFQCGICKFYCPTNIGITGGTLSVVTLVVVSNAVDIWVALRFTYFTYVALVCHGRRWNSEKKP